MIPSAERLVIDDVARLIAAVHRKGARLWLEKGELRYRAPKGALTAGDVAMLRTSGSRIAALFATFAAQEPDLARCRDTDRAPLTYSQLARWDRGRLSADSTIRHLASATRLCGRLDVAALRRSLAELVARHEALRTRIILVDGTPRQQIVESAECAFRVDDLTALDEHTLDGEVRRLIDELILEPIRIDIGPMLGVRLLKLRDEEHILAVAMEHLIGDGYSLAIFLRDLLAIYGRQTGRHGSALPSIAIQFADYAHWQRRRELAWVELHRPHWQRLAACRPFVFPEARDPAGSNGRGWGTIKLCIDRELRARLQEWCSSRGTTLVMSVFTAYVASLMRWCGASEGVIRYETDGRPSAKVENTIGFFAAPIYLRVTLDAGDYFLDLLKRITQEYCTAYEHADFLYLEAQTPELQLVKSTFFNWIPPLTGHASMADDDTGQYLSCSPFSFENPMLKNSDMDMEPSVLIFDMGDDIVADVIFPSRRYSADTMARFGSNFLRFMHVMVNDPGQRIADVSIV